ncbi:MAG: hypothetical protein U5K30_03350 [Acidimicrobiales bacterium]|nr:hypothetical protein [Acidimicrobiales bacterium]
MAAIVHDLRSAYLRDEPVTRHAALHAFTATLLDDNGEPLVTAVSNAHGSAPQTAGLPNREPKRKNKMFETVSALVATVAGKVVLGTAVAAASVGGLHATDFVDVPGLPEQSSEESSDQDVTADADASQSEDETDAADEANEPADAATDGQKTAEAAQTKQEVAAAFAADMEEWSTCAEEAGAAGLNPVEECGERPHPRDYGLTEPPTSQADNRGRPETTPAPDAATSDRGATTTPAPDAATSDRGATTPPQPPAGDAATGGTDNDPSARGSSTPPQPAAGDTGGAPSGTPTRP